MKSIADNLIDFGCTQLGCSTRHPFARYPDYLALCNPFNGKWCALFMRVPARCAGLAADGDIDIANVKLDPLLVSSLKTQPGYAPAWHMNKEHWLTVRLDGSVPLDDVCALLEMSNALVGPKPRRTQGKSN